MESEQVERICAVVSCYCLLPEAEPEPRHFEDWIESSREPLKAVFRKRGFEACKEMLSFRRFVAELNDVGLEEYMKQHLSPEDYSLWGQQG